ncbi:hypothetical protein GYH30_014243, partial [Glycine max]
VVTVSTFFFLVISPSPFLLEIAVSSCYIDIIYWMGTNMLDNVILVGSINLLLKRLISNQT